MPRIPGLTELLTQMQTQTDVLSQLPRTVTDLNAAVRELIQATTVASETIASAQRTAERLERVTRELEEPVRALRPGFERVGRVLDHPAVDSIPETLRRLQADIVPLVHGLRQAQARVGAVTGALRRRRPGVQPSAPSEAPSTGPSAAPVAGSEQEPETDAPPSGN